MIEILFKSENPDLKLNDYFELDILIQEIIEKRLDKCLANIESTEDYYPVDTVKEKYDSAMKQYEKAEKQLKEYKKILEEQK